MSLPFDPKNFTILIADDDAFNRRDLIKVLNTLGFKHEIAENGRLAMTMLQEKHIDLVLLDIQMPEISGKKILGELRASKRFQHLPIIMISAVDDVSTVAECIEIGADDHMPKPFNDVILQARIIACLQRKVLSEQLQNKIVEVERSKRVISDLIESISIINNVAITRDYVQLTGFNLINRLGEVLPALEDLQSDYPELKDRLGRLIEILDTALMKDAQSFDRISQQVEQISKFIQNVDNALNNREIEAVVGDQRIFQVK